VTASAGVTRSSGTNRSVAITSAPATGPAPSGTAYSVSGDVSWELDIFGRIRRNVEGSVASAQASAADLENVPLVMQSELAANYFQLRGTDAEKRLLDTNSEAYDRALQLTINRHNQGVVSGVDVAQAETQLYTTRAQSTDLALARAQFEHAIAILVGKPPHDFSIASTETAYAPPPTPVELPSELLERRPDIAGSERRVAAANAQVGVATAAFFPQLLLAASGGYGSSTLSNLFSLPNRFWSIGPTLVATLFQGGRRRALRDEAVAAYDNSVAVYRQGVLTAFQDVEDNLAALRILSDESLQQKDATDAAERALELARNRYSGGITTYLEVVTAQVTALTNERVSIELMTRRLVASVNLVRALGGGWQTSDLPGPQVEKAPAGEPLPANPPAPPM
jgi:NodT family efflux transporter outer membrane factor (OMF) lipoprotein